MEQNRHIRNTAITILLDWLDFHAEQFRPLLGEGLNSFTHIKPLGELALIRYSFQSPDFRSDDIRLDAWLQETAEQVHAFTETWGAAIDWEQLPESIGGSPEKGAALLIFPIAAQVSGNRSIWEDQVRHVFRQSVVEPVFGQVDAWFAKDLAGMADCRELAVNLLLETLDLPEDKRMQTSRLYLVTHYIFFATKMGHRPLDLPAARREALHGYLQIALERKLSTANYDLTAELWLCLHWLGHSGIMTASEALYQLAAIVCTNGFVPGEHDGKVKPGDAFRQHYHACLMTLAALAHAGNPDHEKRCV